MQHLIRWLKPRAITMWLSTYWSFNIQLTSSDYSKLLLFISSNLCGFLYCLLSMCYIMCCSITVQTYHLPSNMILEHRTYCFDCFDHLHLVHNFLLLHSSCYIETLYLFLLPHYLHNVLYMCNIVCCAVIVYKLIWLILVCIFCTIIYCCQIVV